jgi:hypothetical protein
VQDSSVVASDGLDSVTTAVRDRILATRGILENNGGGVSADFVVDDVAIETVPGPLAELGISARAATPASGTAALGLTIRHSTILGSGALGSTGLSVDAIAGTGDVSAPVTLDSSIVQGYATAIDRVATGAGGHSAAASVHTDYSDLSGVETSTNNGVPTGTGSIVDGNHDLSAAPGFVNNVLSDPRGLHLLDTSALIDAGNPVLGQGESPSDGDRAPRDLAGRNGAKAVTDIGAFEFQPHPPVLTVSGPSAPVPAGTVATFAASATDPDPGDALSFSWQFDDGAVASGVAVSHAFASTGTHTATVTVSDLDGFTATASASVVIAAPPARPSITVLKLTPRVLIAAISGPTITPSRHVGALVSYRDSVSASTTLTVVRVVAGVRRGGRCFVLTGKPRHRARCSITRTIGSFTRADRVGANRFRFSGRLGGRSLAAGTYRLVAQPQSSAGTGKAVSAPFRVRLG